MRNHSVPVNTILPHLYYKSVAYATEWLERAFGFREHYRYGDSASGGAQIRLGEAYVMIASAREGSKSPAELGGETQRLTIFVDDVDAHLARATQAGAKIVEGLHETEYGERQYGAEDLEGHRWIFSQHVCDVRPEEWGAVVAR